MTIDTNTSDRLLTEVERQDKYLARLPDDFSYPLFNAAQALESQRRSGYRNTASAARELIGNAVALGCDVFCTCDRATIVTKREHLGQIPLRILTPIEWWAHIRPWAGLWS